MNETSFSSHQSRMIFDFIPSLFGCFGIDFLLLKYFY